MNETGLKSVLQALLIIECVRRSLLEFIAPHLRSTYSGFTCFSHKVNLLCRKIVFIVHGGINPSITCNYNAEV